MTDTEIKIQISFSNQNATHKIKTLLILTIICFLSIQASITSGEFISLRPLSRSDITGRPTKEEIDRRGHKGFISKPELFSIFRQGKFAEGFIINGNDIIEIIKNTDYDIRIKDSIIVGGLNFLALPKKPLKDIDMPKDFWTDKEMKLKELPNTMERLIQIVTNRIEIWNSEIKANKSNSMITQNTYFKKDINFGIVTFEGLASFSSTIFEKGASFYSCEFIDRAIFEDAKFLGQANFFGSIFKKTSSFLFANFKEHASFMASTFIYNLEFSVAEFKDEIDFSYVNFLGDSNFSSASFKGKASFEYATFNGETKFRDAKFYKFTTFASTIFSRMTIFKEASFYDWLEITNSTFEGYTSFQRAKIKSLSFRSASINIVKNRIDFRNAMISEAHFEDIVFEKDIDFSDVKFGIPIMIENIDNTSISGKEIPGQDNIKRDLANNTKLSTVFRYVTFESDCNFIRAIFYGDIAFEHVTFKKEANFTNTMFNSDKEQKFSFSYINFKSLILKWDQFPDPNSWISISKDRIKSFMDLKYEEMNIENQIQKDEIEPLSQVYKRLELYYQSINQLGDANKAYYYWKNIELKEKKHKQPFWQLIVFYIFWYPFKVTSGYGTDLHIIIYSVLTFVFFALLYKLNGNSKLQQQTHSTKEIDFFHKWIRLLDLPQHYLTKNCVADPKIKSNLNLKMWKGFPGFLKFSWLLVFKLGTRNITISGRLFGIDYKWIVRCQWFIGCWLWFNLVFTIYRTVPFIYEIISGIFL